MNKPESCINCYLNKVPMEEFFVNLTGINQKHLYFLNTKFSHKEIWLVYGVLTPLSTIFQLYRDGQFH